MGHLRALLALSVAVATFWMPGQATARSDADAAAADEPVPETVTFIGGGFGHAVGMSQYGAQGRALDGFTGSEIVMAYYTGTDVETIADLPLDAAVLEIERPLWVGLSQGHSSLPIEIASGNPVICLDAECSDSLTAQQGQSWVITSDVGRGGCTFTRNGELVVVPPPPPPPDDTADNKPDLAPPADDEAGTNTGDEAVAPAEETPPAEESPPANEPPPADVPQEEPPPPPEPVVAPDCRITIELDPGLVSTLDRQYGRGALELRTAPGTGQFHVSASLDLDDYVYGMAEVPTSWHPEALAAQAIAARTYALSRFLKNEDIALRTPGDPGLNSSRRSQCWCHLVDTSADQVYKGWEGEAASWVAAADATASRIITYRGPDAASFTRANVIEAYYSSSNGGVSQSNTGGFGSTVLYPYLVPVDDHWSIIESVNNPLASWEKQFDVATVLNEIAGIDPAGPVWDQLVTVQAIAGPLDQMVRFEGMINGRYVTKDVFGWQMRRTFGLRSPQVSDVRLTGEVCAGHFATIHGSAMADEIVGTPKKDVIFGYGGADTIDGRGGDDVICAGNGNDRVNGGRGADTIVGGHGNDTLYGNQGHDFIAGGRDPDFIDGGAGNDTVRGGGSLDIIHGGNGRDELVGGPGEDVLYGDEGHDVLNGGPDGDHLFGGPHGDVLSGYGGDDELDGGDKFDDCRGGRGIDSATNCELVSRIP